MSRVLVLNASWEPINVTSVRRAVVLVLKEKAEVLEDSEVPLRAETVTLSAPAVIRLVTYVKVPYTSRKRITRRAVFARDDWSCLYCGSTSKLTVDHIVPRCRGGEHVWENLASACTPCNHRKGHAELVDVGMSLRRQPTVPKTSIFVYVAVKVPPAAWHPYLGR